MTFLHGLMISARNWLELYNVLKQYFGSEVPGIEKSCINVIFSTNDYISNLTYVTAFIHFNMSQNLWVYSVVWHLSCCWKYLRPSCQTKAFSSASDISQPVTSVCMLFLKDTCVVQGGIKPSLCGNNEAGFKFPCAWSSQSDQGRFSVVRRRRRDLSFPFFQRIYLWIQSLHLFWYTMCTRIAFCTLWLHAVRSYFNWLMLLEIFL